MPLKPGDIIRNVSVSHQNIHGWWKLSGADIHGFLVENRTGITLGPGISLPEVVYLGENRFAAGDWVDPVIHYFYSTGRGTSPEARDEDAWQPRWREVATGYRNIACQDLRATVQPPRRRQWRLVKSSRWVMPVAISSYAVQCGPETTLCPASLKRGSVIKFVLSPCYAQGAWCDGSRLPHQYRGHIRINHQHTAITIYLHGFLDLTKWHYGIWKHLLYGTNTPPNYSDAAKRWWQNWVGYKPADYPLDIFAGCLSHEGGCNPCNPNQFLRVHERLQNLLQLHWQKLITFWKDIPTKNITVTGNSQPWEVEILTTQRMTIEPNNYVWPWLIVRGWLWQQDGAYVLHCSPVTFYMKNNPSPLHARDATTRFGNLYNIIDQ